MKLTMGEWIRLSEPPGPFRVTRWCCRSGNCVKCMAAFRPGERVRVVQMDGLNGEAAQVVREGWAEYGSEIEEVA